MQGTPATSPMAIAVDLCCCFRRISHPTKAATTARNASSITIAFNQANWSDGARDQQQAPTRSRPAHARVRVWGWSSDAWSSRPLRVWSPVHRHSGLERAEQEEGARSACAFCQGRSRCRSPQQRADARAAAAAGRLRQVIHHEIDRRRTPADPGGLLSHLVHARDAHGNAMTDQEVCGELKSCRPDHGETQVGGRSPIRERAAFRASEGVVVVVWSQRPARAGSASGAIFFSSRSPAPGRGLRCQSAGLFFPPPHTDCRDHEN